MYERGKLSAALVVIFAFCLCVLPPWGVILESDVDLSSMLRAPSLAHPLGTDNLGRDLLVRMAGVMTATVLPLWSWVLAVTVGIVLLTTLTFARPNIARIFAPVFTLLTLLSSFPAAVLAFIMSAIFAEAGLRAVAASLAVVLAARTACQIRQLYLRDHRRGYWLAHEVLGGSPLDRIWRYGIVREWRSELVLTIGFHLQAAVTIETAISYLGFGVQEPMPSFGNILAAHLDRSLAGDFGVTFLVIGFMLVAAFMPPACSYLVSSVRRQNSHSDSLA